MKKRIWYSIIILLLFYAFLVQSASAITSDDFNSSTLNESLWTIIDPGSDATITTTGVGTPDALLSIIVPAGASHDVWDTGNLAPRIMQSVSNTDFEVEVKFQSHLSQKYQMQGVIIEQDSGNFLRFDFYSDGSNTRIFAANFTPDINTGGLIPALMVDKSIGGSPSSVPLYMRVKREGNQWTQSYSFNGISWTTAVSFSRALTVNKMGPFAGNHPDITAPAFTCLIDYFFNTASPVVPEDGGDNIAPNIAIWYGNSQSFGQIGVPQRWVNILGNTYDSSGVSLAYSLNGASSRPLTVGPDGMRLQSNGDFNVEIDRNELTCGNNQVEIRAVDNAGNTRSETVLVNYSCNNVWPRTYSINWNDVNNIQDAAQIVDGLWVKEPSSIRPGIIGYDRLVAIGDITWDDYEVMVPVTINAPLDSSTPEGGPLVGMILRWQGHYDRDGKQPRNGWVPLGALGGYDWVSADNVYRLRIVGNNMQSIAEDASGRQLSVGVPYMFKMRAKTIGANTLYSLKVWEQGTFEPTAWTISGYGVSGELKQGSLLLLSHYANASFGNVTIIPGPFYDDTTAPIISNVTTEVYAYSTTIRWDTDEPATSEFVYGPTTAYENGSLVDGTMVTSHTITLLGLKPGREYHYKITSVDNSGNSASTADMNFTTTMDYLNIISDDFNSLTLNTSLWTIVDPRNNATITTEGYGTSDALLNITVPAGTSHDIWDTGNLAPRIMQSVSNNVFEVEMKFQSPVSQKYQMQGLIIEQDSGNFLVFEFYSDGTNTRIFAASFTPDINTGLLKEQIIVNNIISSSPGAVPLYMRVKREGNQWTQSYSYNGISWTTAASFNKVLTVNKLGPFAGNHGVPESTAPGFTCLIDYFFNTASPVVPEDTPATLVPPSITTHPSGQTVIAGQTATFSVVVTGTEPLTYQWQKNGMNIPGATGATYTTLPITLSDNGSTYRVNVTNPAGSAMSNAASLITQSLPILITILSPDDGIINNTGYVNVSVMLNRPGTAILNWEGIYESMTGQGISFYRNKTGLLSGNYSFAVYANESGDVFNISGPRNITIDRKITTSLADIINTSTFITNSKKVITSPGGNVTVTIPNQTNASVNSSALTSISIDSLAQINSTFIVDLGSDKLIGENITLGPEGAVFDPDIQLRFNYSGSQLTAAGINSASQLRIKYYNDTTKSWDELVPYALYQNGSDGYLIANASHFSTFALIGIPVPPSGNTPCCSHSGSSGGGGGGGGTSGENFLNIEVKEKYDLYIFKDIETSYKFTNSRNPIMFINITGNLNTGEVTTAVEVLKNTSSLVRSPAPGRVYKNMNVWVGTSGFAQPKNIKIAVIRFKVPNTWLENNNIETKDIKMVRWNGSEWIGLDTIVKEKESIDIYFEAETDSFSPLAITGLGEPISTVMPQISLSGITATVTPSINDVLPSEGPKSLNFSNIVVVFTVISIVIAVYFKRNKLKFKK